MPITPQHVSTLRAFLAGDQQEYQRLRGELKRNSVMTDYLKLQAVAFITSVLEYLGEGAADSDIRQTVADIRMRSAEIATEMDPNAAERLIRSVTHDEDISDIDDKTVTGYQTVLLYGIVHELIQTGWTVDQFIDKTQAFLSNTT